MTVRLPVSLSAWNSYFDEILYLRIFRKYIDKLQVSLKSNKITGTLHDFFTFMPISFWFLLRMGNALNKFAEKIKHTFYVK
jgi:hypothetical protein